MIIRPAKLEDARLLWEWRNDPGTRANCTFGDQVPWEMHLAWLTRKLSDPNTTLLVGELNGRPVGTIRIDHADESELSWTVAPEVRGQGVGAMLARAVPDDEPLFALIRADNLPCRRLVARIGFVMAEAGEIETWRRPASAMKLCAWDLGGPGIRYRV